MLKGKIIDLTAEIYDNAPTMPMDPKCSVSEHCNLDTLGYNLARITLSTHQGTHLDAPFHFFDEGETVDKISLYKCIVRAIKVDLTYKKPKENISIEDVLKYEPFVDRGISLLFYTGWDKLYPKKEFFSDFPYVSKELAQWLAEKKVGLIGLDFPCPNITDWKIIHEILLGNSVLIVEGLVNMEELGEGEFTFFALPLKIRGRDGSPVRAIAIKDT
jgi:kynurenine formamidase